MGLNKNGILVVFGIDALKSTSRRQVFTLKSLLDKFNRVTFNKMS